MEDGNKTASPEEVKVIESDAESEKVITVQPIPEDPSESEPVMEKKRSNMVGRGDYVHTTKVTSTTTQRWDDRCASCNCGTGGDAECCDILLGCLLCHCLFGGGSDGGGSDCGDCGDCLSACECQNCGCDCGDCDCDFD